jgi:hypothetical protein
LAEGCSRPSVVINNHFFFNKQEPQVRIIGRLLFDEAVESGDEPNSADDFEMEEEENDQFNNLILPIEDKIFLNSVITIPATNL